MKDKPVPSRQNLEDPLDHDATAEIPVDSDYVSARESASSGSVAGASAGSSSNKSGSAHAEGVLTVLVIDDSKTIRRSATTLLSEEGWNVVTAEDGFDALGKVVAHKPDIIFADIMMPRLNGYQACALIKNNAEYRNIPVIMLSSKDSIFDKARGRIAGSEHYLTKPFTRRELVRAVQRAVRRQRVASRRNTAPPSESSINSPIKSALEPIEA